MLLANDLDVQKSMLVFIMKNNAQLPWIGQMILPSSLIWQYIFLFHFLLGQHIYLWRKVVCFVLFCSYEIHWTRMLQIMFLVSLESSWWGGLHGLHSIMFGLAVQNVLEYWMISSLKIILNHSWKFGMESECTFGVVGRILMRRIKWILFGKILIQNVGDIEFQTIFATENSNKFKKPRFWKEKSVEDVVTLGPTAQATLV